MSVVSKISTRESKLPVAQLVFVARGAFPLSAPGVCALRGFLPGRVSPDRTTRRHGLARLLPNWVGLAGRVVTFGGAAGKEVNSTFLGAVAVRHCASRGTDFVLLPFLSSAAGGASQRQVRLSPSRSMADGGGHGDPPADRAHIRCQKYVCFFVFWGEQEICKPPWGSIVCKVGHMPICCTGTCTNNSQIASERLQYRIKRHVLGHIRPPSTLQNFKYSIETIFAF